MRVWGRRVGIGRVGMGGAFIAAQSAVFTAFAAAGALAPEGAALTDVPETGAVVWVTLPKVPDGSGFPARVIAVVP
jgi:hypothetical protein